MKTIGLLGGMSWESTIEYYRIINQAVKARLGGLHSAKIVMHSVDFDEVVRMQRAGDWAGATQLLGEAGAGLAKAGAECVLICTNTMHKVADQVQAAAGIPLIHIADATGQAVRRAGAKRVGLIGTAFTMTDGFCRTRLAERYGLEVLVPNDADMAFIHEVIFGELCVGEAKLESKREFCRIISDLVTEGAEGVILGCTEIPLLVKPCDCETPLYDTTAIHALAAVDWALA